MSYRAGYWGIGGYGGNNNSGISRQTAIITAVVVVVLVVASLIALYLYRRRKLNRRMISARNHTRPTLPTHMSQLPHPPAAYIRPTSNQDLPAYRPPPPTTSASGSQSAWATPAPPYKPRTPPPAAPILPSASPNDKPVVSSPPRRSIFRRPVPPLHTVDDLAPPITPVPGMQSQVLPQVTPYERRRGEHPFGPGGLDGRHPGMAETEAGDAGNRGDSSVLGTQDAPPGYAETPGRS